MILRFAGMEEPRGRLCICVTNTSNGVGLDAAVIGG